MSSAPEVVRYSMHGMEAAQPGLEPVLPPKPAYGYWGQSESRICGVRKMTFCLIAILVALSLAVVGIAVGLGVEMNAIHQTQQAASTVTFTTSPATEATSSSLSTTRASTTSALTTSTIDSSPTSSPSPSTPCPSSNGTILTTSLGSVQYRLMCDSDFGGSAKLTLSSIVVDTFDECLDLCNSMNYFQSRADVGCTYNVAGTGTQTPGTCWCLGGEGKTVVVNVGNDAAVPVGEGSS